SPQSAASSCKGFPNAPFDRSLPSLSLDCLRHFTFIPETRLSAGGRLNGVLLRIHRLPLSASADEHVGEDRAIFPTLRPGRNDDPGHDSDIPVNAGSQLVESLPSTGRRRMTDSEVNVLSFREKESGAHGVNEIVSENPLERGQVILAGQPGLL